MIMTTIWLSSQLACWCVTRCCCALNFVWISIEGDLSRVVWFSECWTMIQHDPTMQHRGLGLFFQKSLFSWASQLPLRTSDFLQDFDLWQISDTSTHEARSPLSTLWTLSARVSWRSSLGSIWTSTAHRCVFLCCPKRIEKTHGLLG